MSHAQTGAETASAAAQPKRAGFSANVISGLATGLFSIPEGMAYAQLAGVNPVYGLYSGIVATIVASLTTGAVLMMSALTSAIALTTAGVMQNAGIQSSQMPQALFTITFLTGAITFFSALFIPLQYTIFLGALLSPLLYVGASSRKFRLQQAVRLGDGGWEMQDAPRTLTSHQATVLIIQGLDFFAEVPALDDQMPPTRGVSDAAVILVMRDMRQITSTAIKWLERYAQNLKADGSVLMLADVNPKVLDTLKKSGALDILGAENVFPATKRVLAAENTAWDAAQQWLKAHQ
jgi:SulP family sulfate permease